MIVLSCIVCGYQPETAYNGCDHNQPYNATTFKTHGHYGSTFFDSMSEYDYLEINICDDCLNKAVDKQQILRYNRREISIYKGHDNETDQE